MPRVEMPDGTEIDFPDGTDPAVMSKAAADYWAKNGPTLENKGRVGAARATGVLQGAMAGFGDEFLGAVGASGDYLTGNMDGKSWADRYGQYRDKAREDFEQYREERPWESFGVTAASGIAPAIATGGSSTATTVGARALAGAKTGALWGGIAGFGSGEGDIMEGDFGRMQSAAAGAGTGGVLGGGVGAATPYVVNAVKWLAGRLPTTFTPSGQLTPEAQQALKQLNIDPSQVTDDVLAQVRQSTQSALNVDDLAGNIRMAEARTLPVPVPQTRGMVTQDPAQQMFENQGRQGAYGTVPQALLKTATGQSQDALRANVPAIQAQLSSRQTAVAPQTAQPGSSPRDLGGLMRQAAADRSEAAFNRQFADQAGTARAPGQPLVSNLGEGGQMVANRLQEMATQAKTGVNQAYEAARAAGPAALPRESATAGAFSISNHLAGKGFTGAEAPRVLGVVKELEDAGAQADGAVLIDALFAKRARLSALSRSSDQVEATAAGEAKKAFDGWIAKQLDDALLTGDQTAVAAWRNAIAKRREFGKMFEGNDLIETLTEKTQRGGQRVFAVAPEDAANVILGRASTPNLSKQNLSRDLVRLKEVLGDNSDAWHALREEVFLRFAQRGLQGVRKGEETIFSGTNLAKSWDKANIENRNVLGILFTPQEKALISQYARVAQRTMTPVEGGTPLGSGMSNIQVLKKIGAMAFAGPRTQALLAMLPGVGKAISNTAAIPSAYRAVTPRAVSGTTTYPGAARGVAAGVVPTQQ